MLLYERPDRPSCCLFKPIFVPPPNSDSGLSAATAVYAEMMGSKEVI